MDGYCMGVDDDHRANSCYVSFNMPKIGAKHQAPPPMTLSQDAPEPFVEYTIAGHSIKILEPEVRFHYTHRITSVKFCFQE